MKIEFKPDQHYTTYNGWTYTWFLIVSTKKEHFWLVSYEVMSLVVGVIIILVSVPTFFIAISHKEIAEKLWDIIWHLRAMFIILYIVLLACSVVELDCYLDCDDSRKWKRFGRLEVTIMVIVRLVRGLPIIILGMGIIYGLFYLVGLLIGLL